MSHRFEKSSTITANHRYLSATAPHDPERHCTRQLILHVNDSLTDWVKRKSQLILHPEAYSYSLLSENSEIDDAAPRKYVGEEET